MGLDYLNIYHVYYVYTQTAVDEGDIRTWWITIILIAGKPEYPQLELHVGWFLDLHSKSVVWSLQGVQECSIPKMQNFKNFYYNKDNRIWYFDLSDRAVLLTFWRILN